MTILVFYGLQRRWPLVTVALLIGFATACRVVGWILIPVLISAMYSRASSAKQFVLQCLVYVPLATWGIVSFMLYQYLHFGDALLFVKAAREWAVHPATVHDTLDALWLKPIIFQFDPKSPYYWGRRGYHESFSATSCGIPGSG
jgi:hypothetical protein